MPALLLQSEAGGMLANGFTVLCLLSPGGGVERSSGSLPGRPNVVSGVAGTCPRATPVSRRSAVGMAHKRSIRLQCMMSDRFASVVPTELSCSNRLSRRHAPRATPINPKYSEEVFRSCPPGPEYLDA